MFIEGSIIKGKELKSHKLCKILNEDMSSFLGVQYHMGLNTDVNDLSLSKEKNEGLYFSLLEDGLRYLEYGNTLVMLTIPENEDVYVMYNEFRAKNIYIHKKLSLKEISTWKYLQENGVDITDDQFSVMSYAVSYGDLNLVKYLKEQGASLTGNDNLPLQMASLNGYLDIVQYLHENGVSIQKNDYAILLAKENNHTEVVEYLKSNITQKQG